MNVFFLSAEMAPFAKVGGLADVVGALPAALADEGCRVSVFLPFYQQVDAGGMRVSAKPVYSGRVQMGSLASEYVQVFKAAPAGLAANVYLFQNNRFFGRPGVYTDPVTGDEYGDAALRYAFFCRACLEFIVNTGMSPDVIHCHDAHTAVVPALLERHYRRDLPPATTGTMLTVHNIAYPGIYPPDILDVMEIPRDEFRPMSPFEYWGKVNFLKVGIEFADVVTTVSERYAREIRETEEYGCGLQGVLRKRGDAVVGVLNGVDYSDWDPQTDPLIPARYGILTLEGKRENKEALLREYQFARVDFDRPVVGMVGRMVDQKGVDLLAAVLPELAKEKAYLVMLGSGLKKYQDFFLDAAREFPGFLGVRIGFDNRLAHLIEAGSDMFLMPSRFEPCGLNQMYSLKYGTVPVVRATGGLADTVRPLDAETGEGNGFVFEEYTPGALLKTVRSALVAFGEPMLWKSLMVNGMGQDFSWSNPARRYLGLYESILLRRASMG